MLERHNAARINQMTKVSKGQGHETKHEYNVVDAKQMEYGTQMIDNRPTMNS
jgi:hypothetical protein